MTFPQNFEHKIDFTPLRQQLREYCVSPMGRDRVDALRFLFDKTTIERLLLQTDEMLRLLLTNNEPPLGNLHDCTHILQELKSEGTYATARQLYQISRTLEAAGTLRRFLVSDNGEESTIPHLRELAIGFADFGAVSRIISSVVDSVGEVKDTASDELHRIRREMSSVQQSMAGAMRRAADLAISQGVIESDTQPVMREGRLLLPLPATARRTVPGIVFDRSATGKTIFVQPAEIIEAENRLQSLRADEHKEIVRILTEVADRIRPHIPDLLQCWRLLGVIDFIHAKAILARDLDAQLPHIEEEGEIELFHALHPGLIYSMRRQKREAVPLDLRLDDKNRILLISGPNAGGKSVALKTVAIVQYMTQCGLLPTVRSHSHLRIFRDILVDLGDEQSIQNDLSTYSSHLANMKYMMKRSSPHSLILIDEIGSGTEPVIGASLARSILLEFVNKGAYGIITTHYDSLKQFANKTPGLQNGAMMYDTEQMQPLYRLQQGVAGSSFALEIARKSGLPNHVIARAAKDVGRDYTDSERYIQQIARDRKETHRKRIEIESLERQLTIQQERVEQYMQELRDNRDRMISQARREAEQILSGANAQIERTIREIRQSQADKEKTKEVRRQLQEYTQHVASLDAEVSKSTDTKTKVSKAKQPKPKPGAQKPDNAPILVGDYVKSESSTQTGQVLSIQGNSAEVAFGAIRMKVKLSTLSHAVKPRDRHPQNDYASLGRPAPSDAGSRKRHLNFTPNIDVRGMTVDEAIQAVTYFIDDATQFEVSPVRILHGTGTGALRSALRQYLKTMPAVLDAHDEDVRLGGAGITVVSLRD